HTRFSRDWSSDVCSSDLHKVSGLELGNWLAVARFVPMCSDMGLETQQSFIDAYTSESYLRIIRPDEEKFSRPGEMLAFVSGEEQIGRASCRKECRGR